VLKLSDNKIQNLKTSRGLSQRQGLAKSKSESLCSFFRRGDGEKEAENWGFPYRIRETQEPQGESIPRTARGKMTPKDYYEDRDTCFSAGVLVSCIFLSGLIVFLVWIMR